ncbi:MAG: type II secretion system protein [Clostridia bacterium]|nr:type II secretion system protein [Clostridia bacterium]
MLKKLTNNKKGFSLIEILVAVSILAIIVGPLLIGLFSNNRVIERARKETEGAYVARKIMEETIADYQYGIDNPDSSASTVDGYPVHIYKLKELLNKSTIGMEYSSTTTYKSKYADNFTYDIKITPSGKNGAGTADASADYMHIYTDKIGTQNYNYLVTTDGQIVSISLNATNNFDVYPASNSAYRIRLNSSNLLAGANIPLSESKNNFRILCYASNDADSYTFNFDSSSAWANNCVRYLTNYTPVDSSGNQKVTVKTDGDFIPTTRVENYVVSEREQWDNALYEIVVTVYDEDGEILSFAESIIKVRILP